MTDPNIPLPKSRKEAWRNVLLASDKLEDALDLLISARDYLSKVDGSTPIKNALQLLSKHVEKNAVTAFDLYERESSKPDMNPV